MSLNFGFQTGGRSANVPRKDAENNRFYLTATWKF